MHRWPLFAASLALALPKPARAQDRFEIQVYDSETAGPGNPGLEVHLNYDFSGTTVRSPEGADPTIHVMHVTFEPHLGIGDWGEAGAYLQSAFIPGPLYGYGPEYVYAGAKVRFKVRYPKKLFAMLGLAVNFEISDVPEAFEPNRWGSEIRLIADLRWRALYFAINPIIDTDLQGPIAGQPQFAPAAKASVFLWERIGLTAASGLEYYGVFGPFRNFLPPGQQYQSLYAVVDLTSDYVDLNIGLGHGFAAGEAWVGKAIIGFHPRTAPPAQSDRPPSVYPP
jgi:hypothetical protein